MRAFIGCKIIRAQSMSKEEFEFRKDNLLNNDFRNDVNLPPFNTNTPGYHVQYPNPDGSKYNSWSPKDVFERAYREIAPDEKEMVSLSL